MNIFRGKKLFIILAILILGINIPILKLNDDKTTKIVKSVNETIDISPKEDITKNKIKELQEYYKNNDIEGIITIDGIKNFSYPIVKTKNNDYYLNHNYYKKYDPYGAIYADYRVDLNTSSKILIYGHSSTKKNVPFNELESYYNKDYYKLHKYITIETNNAILKYEIFSVFIETSDFTYMNINFDDSNKWYAHLLKLKAKSMYETDANLTRDDDILILQTCSNNKNYRKYSKKYLLVVSRRVENE